MQLQITAALLKTHNWNTICNDLGLNKEDRTKLKHYFVTRNKQILREDRILGKMREKQLAHLVNMDQSILKNNDVPLQLVLSKISRNAHAVILEMSEPELEFCRADDILAARQLLRKHGLDEGLAGEWGSPLVELTSNNHAEEDILPEKFQWRDTWTLPENTFIKPHGPIRDCAPGRSFATLPSFVKSMCSNRGPYNTINPRETFRDDVDPHPLKDWKEHIPFYLRDEFQAMSKKIRERIRRQISGTKDISEHTRVRVGPRGEARLSPTFRDQSLDRWMKREQEKESQRALLRRPHVPLPLFDDGTPSKFPKGTPSPPGTNDTQPVTRSLGGCWSLNDVHPSVSQSRYERQIEDARLESAQERQMRVTQSVDTGTASIRDLPKCFTNLSDEKRKMNFQTRLPSKPVTDLPGHREPLRSRSHVQNPDGRMISISEDDQKVLDDLFFKYIVPGSYTK